MNTILKQAKEFLTEHFGKGTSVCSAMASENIKDYFKHINNFSSTLCVAATGDHVLNCVAYGAKHITVFDRNPLSIYLTKLKLAATTLLRDDFINFFMCEHTFFSHELYLKFVDYLEEDAREFWDCFYTMCHEAGLSPKDSKLITTGDFDIDTYIECNHYLDDSIYYQMRYNVDHCEYKYYLCSLSNVLCDTPYELRYNAAIFSNMTADMDGVFPTEKKWRYIQALNKFVDSILSSRMAFDGEVCYAYIHRAFTGPMWTEIDDIEQLPNKLSDFHYWTVPSVHRCKSEDMSEIDMILYRTKTLDKYPKDKTLI